MEMETMEPKPLYGIGVLLAALMIVGAVFVPAVSAIDDARAPNNAANPDIDSNRDLRAIKTPDFSTQEIVVSPPLSEKDLITIIFTDEWLAEKDTSEYPDRIEFSKSENVLKNAYFDDKSGLSFYSPVAIDEMQTVVSLRIPKSMYELKIAMSKGNISFPTKYFDNYPDLNSMLSTVNISTPSEPEVYVPTKARATEYVEPPLHGMWVHYPVKPEYADSIVHLEGLIKPSSFTNNGHDHAIYQEREIYLNNDDAVEYVFFYDEDYYGDKIWLGAVIYDNSPTFQGCPTIKWFDATSCHWYDYEFTIDDDSYYIYFKDRTTGSWNEHIYSDTDDASDAIDKICGSAEVYADVPVQHSFEAITYRMIDEYAKTSGGVTKLPGEVFSDGDSYTSGDEIYSFVSAWISSNRIYTYHENDNTL